MGLVVAHLVAQQLLRIRRGAIATPLIDHEGVGFMATGKVQELKGRVKEAAGALTGNAKLKREGQVDQAVGKVKQKTEKVIDKVKEAVE
jgi:uncharacterized protein YjbJ (UPF0337 family)